MPSAISAAVTGPLVQTPIVSESELEAQSSEKLAERAAAGCADSFEALVIRHENQIFNFLNQFTRNPHDAEDLTQVTFLKAYRGLDRYLSCYSFASWLFTIARRTAANHFRSLRNFEELTDEHEADLKTPASTLEDKDERNGLWDLARTLKPKQFEVLWLRYGQAFSTLETARIMKTNQIHVKVLLHRARAGLSKKLLARGTGSTSGVRLARQHSGTAPPLED